MRPMGNMNNQGWIKLHRKIIGNQELLRSDGAFKLLIVLLCIVDDGGKWCGGRFQLAKIACLKDSNTYKALKRLENLKIVTLRSNNKYTEISLVNWGKYQVKVETVTLSSNNGVTTEYQRSNTLIKNKNKELRNNKGQDFKFLENKQFGMLWIDYLEMRKKIKKPATGRAEELILKKLHKHRIEIATAMVEKSIENSWQGVFELRPEESEAIMRKVEIVESNKKTELQDLTDEDVKRNKTALAKMRASLADKFSLKN